MTTLLFVYGAFNAICVGILVLLAQDPPSMDEDRLIEAGADYSVLSMFLAAQADTGLPRTGLGPVPLHRPASA